MVHLWDAPSFFTLVLGGIRAKNAAETSLEPTDLSIAAYDSDDAVEVIQDSESHSEAEEER